MSRPPGVLVALVLGCVSCTPGEPGPGAGLGYRPALTLGSNEGPGALPGYSTDLLRRADRSWVLLTAPGLPMLFTAEGRFVRELGASGEGPGEFRTAYFGAVLPGDSLLVSDPAQGRAQIIHPDEGVSRSVRLPCRAQRIRPVSWPDSVLFVGRSCGTELGPWLRLVDLSGAGGRLRLSFGDSATTRTAADRRVISSPGDGEVWLVSGERELQAGRWSLDGRRLAEWQQEPRWLADGSAEAKNDSFPRPAVVAVEVLPGDTLVVGALVPRPDWREAWSQVDDPGPYPGQRPHEAELWETLVEFRDPATGEVLGSQRLPGILFRILPDGAVATRDIRGPGFPFVTLHTRTGGPAPGLASDTIPPGPGRAEAGSPGGVAASGPGAALHEPRRAGKWTAPGCDAGGLLLDCAWVASS